MVEPRGLHTLQDNLLLSFEISVSESELRDMDYLYVSRFLKSLVDEELNALWMSSITVSFVSDLDLVLHLCKWVLPFIEEKEWYELCSGVLTTMNNCKLFSNEHPGLL
jgi:hypothetical protein